MAAEFSTYTALQMKVTIRRVTTLDWLFVANLFNFVYVDATKLSLADLFFSEKSQKNYRRTDLCETGERLYIVV
jgi:hypothetical protein